MKQQLALYDLHVSEVVQTEDFKQETNTVVTTFVFPGDQGLSGYVNIDVGGSQNLFLGLLLAPSANW